MNTHEVVGEEAAVKAKAEPSHLNSGGESAQESTNQLCTRTKEQEESFDKKDSNDDGPENPDSAAAREEASSSSASSASSSCRDDILDAGKGAAASAVGGGRGREVTESGEVQDAATTSGDKCQARDNAKATLSVKTEAGDEGGENSKTATARRCRRASNVSDNKQKNKQRQSQKLAKNKGKKPESQKDDEGDGDDEEDDDVEKAVVNGSNEEDEDEDPYSFCDEDDNRPLKAPATSKRGHQESLHAVIAGCIHAAKPDCEVAAATVGDASVSDSALGQIKAEVEELGEEEEEEEEEEDEGMQLDR